MKFKKIRSKQIIPKKTFEKKCFVFCSLDFFFIALIRQKYICYKKSLKLMKKKSQSASDELSQVVFVAKCCISRGQSHSRNVRGPDTQR